MKFQCQMLIYFNKQVLFYLFRVEVLSTSFMSLKEQKRYL